MGLLGSIIAKGVTTAATNSTIKAVGNAAATVIATGASKSSTKEDVAVKNGVVLIKPTRSSDDYCGENALEIARELLGAGFESVTFKPRNSLSERAKKRYGEIEMVSINGKDNFAGVKKVPASSYIVIEYLDFKKNVDPSVYASVERIYPGVLSRIAPTPAIQQEPVRSIQPKVERTETVTKKFCPFCGTAIAVAGAKFCISCGKQIGNCETR